MIDFDDEAGIAALLATLGFGRKPDAIVEKKAWVNAHQLCAGVAIALPDDRILFLHRGKGVPHPLEWTLPGGHVETGETIAEGAQRECMEETGFHPEDLIPICRVLAGDVDYTTFYSTAPEEFTPELNDENTEYVWAKPSEFPEPLHPRLKNAMPQISAFVVKGGFTTKDAETVSQATGLTWYDQTSTSNEPKDKTMPWKSNADLPDGVRNSLPDEAQTVFRNVANRVMQDGGKEVSAIRQAWTAVKNGWEKHGDNWVRKPPAEKLSKGTDTMSDQIAFFLPFEKKEKQPDGSIIVQGYASTPTKDLDGEIISLDAVKKALPGYMEWRNIRQMHQPIAVGTAKEAHVDDNGLFLRARIVEPGAVNLVDQGVLQGYSIGGRKLAKKGDVITDLELIEISLVDRPCNPDCRFNVTKGATVVAPHRIDLVKAIDQVEEPPLIKLGGVELARGEVGMLGKLLQKFSAGGNKTVEAIRPQQTLQPLPSDAPQRGEGMDIGGKDEDDKDKTEKREFSDKQRQRAAASGHAMPGGGYPIENTSDLSNAVQAFGRAKDKAKTKRHIIRQAKRLGATHLLPADWPGSTKSKESFAKAADLYTVSNMIAVLGQLESLEEACEGEAGFCIPCGGTTINPGKEFNDQFGTLLTQFADMVADLLDRIIADMKTEEAGEAAEKLSKAFVLADRLAKRKIDDVNEQIARELAVTHQAMAKDHDSVGDAHLTEGLPAVGRQYKQSAKLHRKAAKHFNRAADHFSVGNLDKGHDRMKDGHKAAEEAEKHDKDSFIKSPINELGALIANDPMAKLDGFAKGDNPPPDAPRAGVAVDVFAELTGLQ